jgi:hypothetical protein
MFYGTAVLGGETDFGDLQMVPASDRIPEPVSTRLPRIATVSAPGPQRLLEENQ